MLYYLRADARAPTTERSGRRELAQEPVGQAALPARSSRGSTSSGRSCPVAIAILLRVQRRPLAHDVAGLLAALVHGRDGQRAPRPDAAGRARAHARSSPCCACFVATPLGVALALGLQRWRGRGSGTANTLMLLPLVTPEIVFGVALFLLFLQVLPGARARHDGAGDRPGDVHALVGRRDRARAARVDRAGRRGGGGRPRRAAARSAAAACCCRCWRRRSSRALRSSSRSRSTTSSSPSTCSERRDTTTVPMRIYSSGARRADAGAQRAGHDHAR